MSGFLERTPSPEQGRSAMTRSKASSQSGRNTPASDCSGRTQPEKPVRATFSLMRSTFCGERSALTMLPSPRMQSAAARLLPPGAAQRSRTRSPGFGCAACTASEELRSCTKNIPSASCCRMGSVSPSSAIKLSGAYGDCVSPSVTPAGSPAAMNLVRFRRSVSGAGSRKRAAIFSLSSLPNCAVKRSASHGGKA